MTWRVVAATAAGTSHVERGEACQDRYWAGVLATPEPVVSLWVADGAGSAVSGAEGAALAVAAAHGTVEERVAEGSIQLTGSFAAEILRRVRELIAFDAATFDAPLRDYATTLLGLVSVGQSTLVVQVGDGAVVVDCGEGLELALHPPVFEYANATHFVTDDEAVDRLRCRVLNGRVLKAALLSDGLQALALDLASWTPYRPFFDPLFSVLLSVRVEQEAELPNALGAFLNSPAVNDRTDDDKTLVLAVAVKD